MQVTYDPGRVTFPELLDIFGGKSTPLIREGSFLIGVRPIRRLFSIIMSSKRSRPRSHETVCRPAGVSQHLLLPKSCLHRSSTRRRTTTRIIIRKTRFIMPNTGRARAERPFWRRPGASQLSILISCATG